MLGFFCSKIKFIYSKKIYSASYIICVIFITLTIKNDLSFFNFSYQERTSYFVASGNPNAFLFYIVMKIIFTILMLLFFNFIAKCWTGILDGNVEIKNRVKIHCTIFVVYALVLIHVYPGIWWCNNADEFQLFSFAKNLQIQYHQGPLESMAYILALMCYPKPVMVVLFQGIIGSIILGNIVYDLYSEDKKNKILLFLLLFSPCALYFAAYPMRAYLFAVFFLAFIHYYLKFCTDSPTHNKDLYYLTILLCFVINYRTEAKFLLLVYPFLLLKKCDTKTIIRLELIAVCSVIFVSQINVLGFHGCNKAHKYLMFSGPLSVFLADDGIDKAEWESDIQNINKVFSVDQLIEQLKKDYISGAVERPDSIYTDKDIHNFLKSSVKIMLKHPDIYIKSKLKCARDSLALGTYHRLSYALPKEIKPVKIAEYFYDVDKNTHDIFAAILAGQYRLGNILAFYILHAIWIPCGLLGVTFFIGLYKQSSLAIASAILIIQFSLTVFTAPMQYVMYYFVEYLVGWYLIIYSNRYLSKSIVKDLFNRRCFIKNYG